MTKRSADEAGIDLQPPQKRSNDGTEPQRTSAAELLTTAVTEKAQDATAVQRVLAITELLEHILRFVNIPTLLPSAQRTCRRWQDVVQRLIKTNVDMRKRLFLTPATFSEMMKLQSEFQDFKLVVWDDDLAKPGDYRSVVNPCLKPVKSRSYLCGVDFGRRAVLSAGPRGPNDLRNDMYFTQPPVRGAGDSDIPSDDSILGNFISTHADPDFSPGEPVTVAQIVEMAKRRKLYGPINLVSGHPHRTIAWIYGDYKVDEGNAWGPIMRM